MFYRILKTFILIYLISFSYGHASQTDQAYTDIPEPEFFFGLFFTAIIFGVCCIVSGSIYYWGRRKKSTVLKILSVLPLIPGLIVYMPFFLLLLMWIWYWIFGN